MPTTTAQRNAMGRAMDELVTHRAHVLYLQRRLMATRDIATMAELVKALRGYVRADCSETATLVCHVGGLDDPNGNHYDGEGDTQEMYDHLPHYLNPADAKLGALCFHGIPGRLGTQHVTVVRRPGLDPVLYSHGGSGAFASHYVPLSVERRYHVGEPVFLSIAGLG